MSEHVDQPIASTEQLARALLHLLELDPSLEDLDDAAFFAEFELDADEGAELVEHAELLLAEVAGFADRREVLERYFARALHGARPETARRLAALLADRHGLDVEAHSA